MALPWALALSAPCLWGQAWFPGSPLLGEENLDKFGGTCLTIRDLNGDLVDDLAVGSPQADGPVFNNVGKVYLYSGADTQVWLGTYTGAQLDETAGFSLVDLDDVNGDLVPDFAVGAPLYDGAGGADQGRVLIVSGSTFPELFSFTINERGAQLGYSLANAGDRDADGREDLLVGAPFADAMSTERGSAFLLRVSSIGISLIQRFDGTEDFEHLGLALCSLPDANADSVDEIVLASPDYDGGIFNRGRVQVLSGASAGGYPQLLQILGTESFDQIGWSLAPIDDPDGTDTPHLAISTMGRTNGALNDGGGAEIFAIPSGTLSRSYQGDLANSKLGLSLAVLEDQDGDGIQDLLLGSPLASAPAFFSGMVELVSVDGSGAVGGTMQRLFRLGGVAGERLGQAVAALDDANNDGCQDYVASATGFVVPPTSDEVGAAYAMRSNRPRLDSDAPQYNDLSPVQLSTTGYAGRLAFLMAGPMLSGLDDFQISFSGAVILLMGTLNSRGQLTLNGMLGDFQGQQFVVYLQVILADSGGKLGNMQFSELHSIQIN